MFTVALYIVLSILVGALAYKSGRGVVMWFVISLFITPILSGIILLIVWLMNGNIERVLISDVVDIKWEIKKMSNFDKETIKVMTDYIGNDLEKYNQYVIRFDLTDKNKNIVERTTEARNETIKYFNNLTSETEVKLQNYNDS